MYKIEAIRENTKGLKEQVLLFFLIFLIFITPMPFGSNRPVWSASLAILVGLLLLLWSIFSIKNKEFIRVKAENILYIILPYTFSIIWCFSQILPIWPDGFSHPLWSMAYNVLGVNSYETISINNYETFFSVIKLITYGVVFWISLQIGRSRERANTIFKAVSYTCAFYAVFGIIAHLVDSTKVLGYDKDLYIFSLTSTFLNRNSYATYAGIGVIVTFALFCAEVISKTSNLKGKYLYRSLIINLTTRSYLFLAILAFIITSIIMTYSRAGYISLVVGALVFFFTALCSRITKKRNFLLFFLIFSVIFGLMTFISDKKSFTRFEYVYKDLDVRLSIYNSSSFAIKDHKILGSGLGTFEDIFRLYKDDSMLYNTRRFDNAHNTYIEFMLEAGVPAFILISIAHFGMVLICLKGVFTRKRGYLFPVTGIAVSALVGFHALFDFSIEIPAIAFIYAVIMGVCCAQSWSSRQDLS